MIGMVSASKEGDCYCGVSSRVQRVGPKGAALLLGLSVFVVGCPSGVPMEADSVFGSIDSLRDTGEAVARVYAAPIAPTEFQHTWFVVQRAEAVQPTRWEVFVHPGGIYGYVFADLYAPEADLGSGGTYVVAEVRGPQAEPLIECIESAAANYPCRDFYLLYPGPNSDSFTQWVLNTCEWNVELPPEVVGKDVLCPFAE